MRIGSIIPLEPFPPKMMARIGTAIIPAPLIPTLDMPINRPTSANRPSSGNVSSNENNWSTEGRKIGFDWDDSDRKSNKFEFAFTQIQ